MRSLIVVRSRRADTFTRSGVKVASILGQVDRKRNLERKDSAGLIVTILQQLLDGELERGQGCPGRKLALEHPGIDAVGGHGGGTLQRLLKRARRHLDRHRQDSIAVHIEQHVSRTHKLDAQPPIAQLRESAQVLVQVARGLLARLDLVGEHHVQDESPAGIVLLEPGARRNAARGA